MDWLTKYEGKRGIGAIIVVISCVAPSYFGLFFLENSLKIDPNASPSILLCAAVGGITGLLGTLWMTLSDTIELVPKEKRAALLEELRTKDLTPNDYFESLYNRSIVGGFLIAFASQITFLGIALFFKQNFEWYAVSVVFSTIPIILFSGIRLLIVKAKNQG